MLRKKYAVILSASEGSRMLRKKYAVILSVSEGSRMTAQKNAVILSASEGSRMATHGVLFTGFFVAALLRMTGREWGAFGAPVKPPLKGEVLSEAKRRGLASLV